MNNQLKKYLDDENKIKIFPTKEPKKMVVLSYLASLFEKDRTYNEKEVNEVIEEHNHSFTDNLLLEEN